MEYIENEKFTNKKKNTLTNPQNNTNDSPTSSHPHTSFLTYFITMVIEMRAPFQQMATREKKIFSCQYFGFLKKTTTPTRTTNKKGRNKNNITTTLTATTTRINTGTTLTQA